MPYAMVPEQEVRMFGQVERYGVTWVKLFQREQCKPLLTPWQLIPFLGTTAFDQDAMGSEPDQITAFNQTMYTNYQIFCKSTRDGRRLRI